MVDVGLRTILLTAVLLTAMLFSGPIREGTTGQEFDVYGLEKIWEYKRNESRATFWKLDWSPGGDLVATTFFDNTCVVLNSTDGQVEAVLDQNREEVLTRCDGFAPEGTLPLRCCAFSPDGSLLATGGDDLVVRLYRTSDWSLSKEFRGHTGSILCLDFSPDGRYLASGSGTDKVIPQNAGENLTRIWDLETDERFDVLRGHRDGVLGVKFSHDGERICTVSDDRTVRTWSFPECEMLVNTSGHTSGVLDVGWSPDNEILITGSRDYKIKLWNSTTGEVLQTWSDYNCVRSVDIHPNGDIAATSGVDLTLKIRDMGTGSVYKKIKDGMEQDAMVMSSRWSPDGIYLVSGLGKSHSVIMYSLAGGEAEDGGGIDPAVITVSVMAISSAVFLVLIYYPVVKRIRKRRI